MLKHAPKIPTQWSTIILASAMLFVGLVILVLTDGNIIVAIVPAILLALAAALFTLPLKYTVIPFYSLVLLFHSPAALPMGGKWKGPLYLLGPFIHENLNSVTGIGALKFNSIQIVTVLFLVVMLLRTIVRNNVDEHITKPANRSLQTAVWLSLVGVVFLIVWGILRGGNRSMIPLQAKAFLFAPLFTMILMRVLKTEKMFRLVAKILVAIAVIRVLEGTYFYFAIAAPQGMFLEYIMTHSDTVLFTVALVILMLNVIEKMNRKSILNLGAYGGIIMWGIIINDRRAAFVAVAFCLFFAYFFITPRIRQKLNKMAIILSPILLIYIGIGLKSNAAIFAPVRALTSISDKSDSSNQSRDIENLNLMYTVSLTPVLGSGFGFPYSEITPAVPLPYDFYKYLAHNQILWLAYFGGAVGFFIIWLPLTLGCYFAFRSNIRATNSLQRLTALGVICTVITFMVQTYADMGASGYVTTLFASGAVAISANLVNRINPVQDP